MYECYNLFFLSFIFLLVVFLEISELKHYWSYDTFGCVDFGLNYTDGGVGGQLRA